MATVRVTAERNWLLLKLNTRWSTIFSRLSQHSVLMCVLTDRERNGNWNFRLQFEWKWHCLKFLCESGNEWVVGLAGRGGGVQLYNSRGLGETLVFGLSIICWGQQQIIYFRSLYTSHYLVERPKVRKTLPCGAIRMNIQGVHTKQGNAGWSVS